MSDRTQEKVSAKAAWITFSTDTWLIAMLASVYSYCVMVLCAWKMGYLKSSHKLHFAKESFSYYLVNFISFALKEDASSIL